MAVVLELDDLQAIPTQAILWLHIFSWCWFLWKDWKQTGQEPELKAPPISSYVLGLTLLSAATQTWLTEDQDCSIHTELWVLCIKIQWDCQEHKGKQAGVL